MGLRVWCWNQYAIVAVDGERVSSTKKSTDEFVEDQCVVVCVFWLERHCPSWICTKQSDGKQTVVLGSFSTSEGHCAQKLWIVPELWENQTWRLHHDNALAHMSLLICSYLAKNQTSIVPLPPLFSGLSTSRLSSFPNLKPLWKDIISKPQRRFRK